MAQVTTRQLLNGGCMCYKVKPLYFVLIETVNALLTLIAISKWFIYQELTSSLSNKELSDSLFLKLDVL